MFWRWSRFPHLGGRALWLVPLSFLSMMMVGGAFGMAACGFREKSPANPG
jgi:hydrogenase/urease accessory protein HupE